MAIKFLIAALLASSVTATTYTKCSVGEEPISVRLAGCETQPCTAVHGEIMSAQVDFAADHDITHLKPEVKATVFGVTVTYPLEETNACNSLISSSCPLEEGDQATYELSLPIDDSIPSVNVNVQLSLIDEDTNDVVTCFKVDVQVI